MEKDIEIGNIEPEISQKDVYARPEVIGRKIGFEDLTKLHGEWIREMVFGKEDYTLQAHRGSYKSSCLAVAIALRMILYPKENIIFLRKADNDVSEMLAMVGKILRHPAWRGLVGLLYQGTEIEILSEGADHITTNLFSSPMGAQQLLGLGLKSSIINLHFVEYRRIQILKIVEYGRT